jgi:hypothetical protein
LLKQNLPRDCGQLVGVPRLAPHLESFYAVVDTRRC